MLERKDVMPTNYYKKEAFTGSYQGMRFMLRKKETEEAGVRLEAIVWPQPFCFEKTDEEKKCYADFSFDEQGISDALDWMNGQYSENQDMFGQASVLSGLGKR